MKKKILKNKIGIFQGRLSDSSFLQNYPKDWKREILIAKYLSYSHVEFFLEEEKNKLNPFWSNKERKKIKNLLYKNFKNKEFLICDNYLIKNNLYNFKTTQYLKKILMNLRDFKKSKLILPLNNFYFDDVIKLSNYLNNVLKYKSSNTDISFEIDSDDDKIKKFFKLLKIKNCGITFDTGNIFLKNKLISKTFKLIKNLINHVHIKDRSIHGDNVELGTGLINFKGFFNLLKKENYNDTITLETFRRKNAILQAFKNIIYLNKTL
jgi:L-ribulose-5-phosphate 3-epimerase UlaE